jgi:hypothetical protein
MFRYRGRVAFGIVLATAIGVGIILGMVGITRIASVDTVTVSAQTTCGSGTNCPEIGHVPDPDVDSSLYVTYETDDQESPVPVEPQTGTSWKLTAKYASKDEDGMDCDCTTREYSATFDIDWIDIGPYWQISNQTGIGSTHIRSVDVCSTSYCVDTGLGGDYHSSSYKLHVRLDNPVVFNCTIDGPREFWLDQVLYTTTSVDPGKPISFASVTCSLGSTIYPVSNIFQTGDNGAFECTNSCPPGASLAIQYSN